MNITEVRVKMVSDGTERLRAFCSVTLDDAFVVRDLKVIDGMHGPFVAMPSRKLSDRCPNCRSKNHLRARFCNDCGGKLDEDRAPRDPQGRIKLHADVAHPINTPCRDQVQAAVIEAYQAELKLFEQPGYRPREDNDHHDDDVVYDGSEAVEPASEPKQETAASDCEDGGFDHEELLAELKQTVRKKRGGFSTAPAGFAAGIEPADEATSEEPAEDDHDDDTAAERREPEIRDEPPSTSDEGGFGAGIL